LPFNVFISQLKYLPLHLEGKLHIFGIRGICLTSETLITAFKKKRIDLTHIIIQGKRKTLIPKKQN
jgi:hypothetical protein